MKRVCKFGPFLSNRDLKKVFRLQRNPNLYQCIHADSTGQADGCIKFTAASANQRFDPPLSLEDLLPILPLRFRGFKFVQLASQGDLAALFLKLFTSNQCGKFCLSFVWSWCWKGRTLACLQSLTTWNNSNLSLPKVINVKFPLQPHQKYHITQYEELGFSMLNQMEDDQTTNSHYLTHAFLLKDWENCRFLNLGVKGLIQSQPERIRAVPGPLTTDVKREDRQLWRVYLKPDQERALQRAKDLLREGSQLMRVCGFEAVSRQMSNLLCVVRSEAAISINLVPRVSPGRKS